MKFTEEQYERIARWIDGQDVALNDAERAQAEALRDEITEFEALDVDAPRRAVNAAHNRMRAELAKPRRRRVTLAAIATAAIIALIAIAGLSLFTQATDTQSTDSGNNVAAIDGKTATTGPAVVSSTFRNEVEWTVEPGVIDLRIETVEEELQKENIAAGSPAQWFENLGA